MAEEVFYRVLFIIIIVLRVAILGDNHIYMYYKCTLCILTFLLLIMLLTLYKFKFFVKVIVVLS